MDIFGAVSIFLGSFWSVAGRLLPYTVARVSSVCAGAVPGVVRAPGGLPRDERGGGGEGPGGALLPHGQPAAAPRPGPHAAPRPHPARPGSGPAARPAARPAGRGAGLRRPAPAAASRPGGWLGDSGSAAQRGSVNEVACADCRTGLRRDSSTSLGEVVFSV